MTDETRKLFDAPWRVDRPVIGFDYALKDNRNSTIAETCSADTCRRLARLPELYDALANAVRYACQDCVDQVYDLPTDYDTVKHGCLFKDKNCCEMRRSWIELLRKVRDGE